MFITKSGKVQLILDSTLPYWQSLGWVEVSEGDVVADPTQGHEGGSITPAEATSVALPATTDMSVTGAVTLDATAFGNWHVYSGTTADYTVGLPAAAGNAGKFIGIRMAQALTKLVTLDPNAAEAINGAATLILWAGESVTLECDGTGWVVVGGRNRRMVCRMTQAGAQNIVTATFTKALLDTASEDNTGLMADTSGHKVTIKRPGYYDITGCGFAASDGSHTVPRFLVLISKNGTVGGAGVDLKNAEVDAVPVNSYAYATATATVLLAAGDTIELDIYQNSGANLPVQISAGGTPELSIRESSPPF